MPRFHFHIYDGGTRLDPDGVELASWEDARLEAIARAGHLLTENPRCIALGEDWRMEVTDDTGMTLFRLDFSVIESSAIRKVWSREH